MFVNNISAVCCFLCYNVLTKVNSVVSKTEICKNLI